MVAATNNVRHFQAMPKTFLFCQSSYHCRLSIMHSFSFLLFFLSSLAAHSQKLLTGTVLDADKATPIPKASIFLNNTSVGTTANEEGKFELYIPAGRFELIVSSIGYQTHNQPINAAEITDAVTIKLKIKAPDLEEVIIEPFEKDGWKKWGRWFTDNFIGTSEYGLDTRLINPEALRFRHSKTNSLLTVVATAPLTIQNDALGYRVTYQLENFRFDFKSRYLLYAGYPFFEHLQGSDRKLRKWEAAREDVYYGSLLQFMRAVYRNKIAKEGFEVRRLQKVPNAEKQRVKTVYRRGFQAGGDGRLLSVMHGDSSEYYNRILQQDDHLNIIGKDVLPGDSIAYAADSVTAGVDFPDYLLVIYNRKKVPYEFKRLHPKSSDAPMSEITLLNGRPIEVSANGSFFSPEDLLSTGYWAWWEKMGTMLPFDYVPPKR